MKILLKNFFRRKRNVAITAVTAACFLVLIAGVIMNVALYRNGSLEAADYSHRMLFILNSIGAMLVVFAVEILLRIRFPLYMEIAAVLFGFGATVLATVFNFYELAFFGGEWDTILHTLSGPLFSICGMALSCLVFSDKLEGKRKAAVYVGFGFLFALAVGYLWEIFEFTLDSITGGDLQAWDETLLEDLGNGTYLVSDVRGAGLLDTMKDMIVNLIGAVVYCVPALVLCMKKPERLRAFEIERYPFWGAKKREAKKAEKQASDGEKQE